MSQYYYDVNDTVYSAWSDSQLKHWLVQENIIKSDAQLTRDKMIKLVQCVDPILYAISEQSDYMRRDNYDSAASTFWSAWSDNQIRDYLIEHGYIRSDAQIKKDELIKLANEKYASPFLQTGSCLETIADTPMAAPAPHLTSPGPTLVYAPTFANMAFQKTWYLLYVLGSCKKLASGGCKPNRVRTRCGRTSRIS